MTLQAMNVPPTVVAEMPLDLSAKSSKSPPVAVESPENIRVPSIIDPKPSLFRYEFQVFKFWCFENGASILRVVRIGLVAGHVHE